MFNPKDPNFDRAKAKEILFKNDVMLVFLPSPRLRDLIARGEHPIAKKLGPNIKKTYLEGDGVVIQKRLVMKYIDGTLDDNHTWIFQNGEIKVVGDWARLEDITIRKGK